MQKKLVLFVALMTALGSGMKYGRGQTPGQDELAFDGDAAGSPRRVERQILSYINEMRQDPEGFYRQYLREYIRQNPRRFTRYYTASLERDLRKMGSLPGFSISSTMMKTAAYQADYLRQFNGRMLSHDAGSLSFEQRMRRAGVGCAGENLYTGINRTPLEVVMDLLIDEGVSSLGHRKNLLSQQYKSIGVVVVNYSRDGNIVVMDFSCTP